MVTIGLPVYHAEKWVGEAIESILRQTYGDWELIVTIDELGVRSEVLAAIERAFLCSWREDEALAEGKGVRDERIRIVADGRHLGISARINQQVAMARGECFARMDADDVMLPERLALQVKYLQEHPEVDVCGTGAGEWTFIHPSVMGRTEWFREHPYRSECDGCEDWDLWTRTQKVSKFGFLKDPLIIYRKAERFDKEKYLLRRRQGRSAIRMNRDNLSLVRYVYLLLDSYAKSLFTFCFR